MRTSTEGFISPVPQAVCVEMLNKRVAELERELAEAREVCAWTEDEYGNCEFKGSCGNYTIWEDPPYEIGVKFCSYCGHPIKYQKRKSQEAEGGRDETR